MAAVTPDTFPSVAKQGFPIFVGLRGMNIHELRSHLQVYRKTWREAGHPGNGSVYLRVPLYAGATEKAASEEPYESITYYFTRQSRLVAQDAARRTITEGHEDQQGIADRLAGLTYEQILQTKVLFGSASELVDRLKQLEEELGLDGIVAEMNAGGLIPQEQVLQSLNILSHDVMPAFK